MRRRAVWIAAAAATVVGLVAVTGRAAAAPAVTTPVGEREPEHEPEAGEHDD